MASKGYSLVETIIVIFLVGLMGCFAEAGSKMLMEVQFKTKVTEIEQGLNAAKQMAVSTGCSYNVLCIANNILVRRGIKAPLYRIEGGRGMKLSCSTQDKLILFSGRIAPYRGGTIFVEHKALKKRARITVRIGTGKTTVYIEPL